ncbi:hypothetical protein MCOR25_008124 [Pyricularia grisea]|uniref:Uncharacterized protein n=1 Tax=Pyricularia grisea TaxID=148305 RepID=A0A6P8B1G0_PYRGI|nr:uncharacterized protein PgNI_07045 [Pyricularia grisea]KAI6355680.1 hypothetical protein MCOR25_008124 [Pyricularia grisea]TLD08692.1 hypothetical protein PgNI_07045 [Pyricularia grisea]
MKLISIVLLAIAGTTAAQPDMSDMSGMDMSGGMGGGGMGGDKKDGKGGIMATCNKMFKLEGLEKIAANETLLNKITRNNATRADAIKDKAKKAETELKTYQSNSTLVTECGKIAAERMEKQQCNEMHRLEQLEKIAGNDTLLNEVTKNNATRADDLKKKAEERKATLETLQKNTTLTAFCAGETDKMTCIQMKGMEMMVSKASNQTFLDAKFKNNQTKIDDFKKKATKIDEKLKSLQSNSTLMDVCNKMKDSKGSDGTTNGGRTSSPSNGGASIQPFGVSTSIVALFAAGLLLL